MLSNHAFEPVSTIKEALFTVDSNVSTGLPSLGPQARRRAAPYMGQATNIEQAEAFAVV